MRTSKFISITLALIGCIAFSAPSFAAGTEKTKAPYSETDFLKTFSGKSRQYVAETLGKPAGKEQSVKPTNAEGVIGQSTDQAKPDNVEMWYYKNLVKYEEKKVFKTTEMTFVNDRCVNIAFFNNR